MQIDTYVTVEKFTHFENNWRKTFFQSAYTVDVFDHLKVSGLFLRQIDVKVNI